MDSSEKSTKSVTSPSADEIPKDIAAEFQRMSEDADALLQSIRNDEVQATTPRRGGESGTTGSAAAESSAAPIGMARAGSFDEDDDMTDELHHLETVPDELQRLQQGLDELDQEKLTELIHGSGEDEVTFDPKQIQSTPLPSSSPSPKQQGASCSSSSTPHFALGNVNGNDSGALYCQEVMPLIPSGKPRQRKGAKSSSSSNETSTTALSVGSRRANESSASSSAPPSPPSGVMYPYDPAVAELRELMKSAVGDSDGDDSGGGGKGRHPQAHVPSYGRVIKPAPKSTIESINWVLVAAFVVVWATVIILMGRAHTDLLDEEGEVIQLPSILR